MVERTRMNRAELVRLARLGAEERLRTLTSEIDAIYRHFPELRRPAPSGERSRTSRRRRRMSAAERKAVSQRMRKYWAARRKSKKSAATG